MSETPAVSPHTYCRKSEDRALSESKADACAKLNLSLDKGWMNHRAGAWMLHMPFPVSAEHAVKPVSIHARALKVPPVRCRLGPGAGGCRRTITFWAQCRDEQRGSVQLGGSLSMGTFLAFCRLAPSGGGCRRAMTYWALCSARRSRSPPWCSG